VYQERLVVRFVEDLETCVVHIGHRIMIEAQAPPANAGLGEGLARICKAWAVRYGDDFVAAQRALNEESGLAFASYESALRSWIATVAIIEVGYVGEWEEYTHELMARDYLHELMRLSSSSRAALEQDVAIWDERFRNATIEEQTPHLAPLHGDAGWWQFRSPRNWRQPAYEELGLL
jgi:hypothetical protein